MLDLQQLVSLHGCQLRHSLASVLDKFGPPDQSAVSPVNPDSSVFVNHAWARTAPPLAILTWRGDAGEFVWGIRVLGPGALVPELGFGVGSTRGDVEALLHDQLEAGAASVKIALQDGTLTINFSGDVVTEVQLLAPLTQPV
jgi:hypothetical protein